jgi:hypothetical protein
MNMLNSILDEVYKNEKQKAEMQNTLQKKPEKPLAKKESIEIKMGKNLSFEASENPTPKILSFRSPHDLFTSEIVPSIDSIFRKVYQEFERLRSSSCSRRDLIKFIDIRD